MRKPLLSLAVVALVAGACAGSSAASPDSWTPPDPGHHEPPPPVEEPAATPYDGVTYENPGSNPFVDPQEDRASTFGLDVDTASYTVARRYIDDGNLPDPSSVRLEEFLNFFDQGYPLPEDGTFAIHVDGGPSPFLARDEILLRVGLQARDVADRSRPDASLTFVIDVSGSMDRENRLELVKEALALLVDGLGRDDSVAIVVYGTAARVALHPTRATDRRRILDVIDSLEPAGSTNAEAGLRLGYELAREQLRESGINRVVLASDGVANVGATDAETILAGIRSDARAGIQLVSLGFGMGNFNDALLERLADDGNGFYAYVDTLDEARRIFVDDLTGTLQSVALGARVHVEFDRRSVEAYRLLGFENRAINDENFRDDSIPAGTIGAGHSTTALYALRLSGEGDGGRLATVSIRWTDPESPRAAELSRDVLASDLADRFHDTARAFQLDALVAATAERFRGSRYGEGYRLADVQAVADEIGADLPQTQEVHDFLELLARAAAIER